jgi:hypothetical protein
MFMKEATPANSSSFSTGEVHAWALIFRKCWKAAINGVKPTLAAAKIIKIR